MQHILRGVVDKVINCVAECCSCAARRGAQPGDTDMQTVTLKQHPEILRVIRAADPTYRKTKAFIYTRESVTLHGTYWDGGSRSTYTAVELATGRNKGAPQYAPPQFGGPRQAPEVELPADVVIVETGTFCGKTATATVYVHPANMARLLTV